MKLCARPLVALVCMTTATLSGCRMGYDPIEREDVFVSPGSGQSSGGTGVTNDNGTSGSPQNERTSSGGASPFPHASGGSSSNGGMSSSGGSGPGSNNLFEETFESGLVPTNTTTSGNGRLEVVSNQVHSGSFALRLTQGVGTGLAMVNIPLTSQVSGTVLYTRTWAHAVSSSLTGRVSFNAFYDAAREHIDHGASFEGKVHNYVSTRGNVITSNTGLFPLDTWVCHETELVIDPSVGTITVFVNGSEVEKSSTFDTSLTGPIVDFSYGIVGVGGGQEGGEIYIDDIAVSNRRIGCD